jgi:hypothetical protein
MAKKQEHFAGIYKMIKFSKNKNQDLNFKLILGLVILLKIL